MNQELPKSVLDAADTSAITQLILRERESRDLGRWDEMRECFFGDSVVRISWFRGSGAIYVRTSHAIPRIAPAKMTASV